ncbi:neutral zinc metallopeptidase [Micromonospora maris]|uniref:KPN_02809 family neutral zinc metallopeptidase n=1 Tax=Micromonospora maris TaxID=1003110 RepID=UPI002E14A7FE|nr:neutral zinc metallopeptidase [Micromonospora maris]
MELNENARIDTSQIDDRRGSGGGGGMGIPIPIGGGRGGIVGIVIAVLVALVGGGLGLNAMTGEEGDNAALEQRCEEAPDALEHLDCRNNLYVNSIQAYWRTALPEAFGEQYRPTRTVFFDRAVNTACGSADSGVGPFYCPGDSLVYIDLSFYEVLSEQLGASGEFAQPYVLAHEYGHHVQNLLGTNEQVHRAQQRDPGAANELSVRLELQADCYAGAWAKNATGTADDRGQKIFTSITERDIAEAIDTAEAIGDDAISERANRPVNPDEFTHGSSADRKRWFNRGYESGDPATCDTFSGAV